MANDPRTKVTTPCRTLDCVDQLTRALPGPGVQNLTAVRIVPTRTVEGERYIASFSFTASNAIGSAGPLERVLFRAQLDAPGGLAAGSQLLSVDFLEPLLPGETRGFDVTAQFNQRVIGFWIYTPIVMADADTIPLAPSRDGF